MKRVKLKREKIAMDKPKEEKKEANAPKQAGLDQFEYPLLTDNRHRGELFSRVSRYIVNHYYPGKNGESKVERIFYPSEYGLKSIRSGLEISKEQSNNYALLYERLQKTGVGTLEEDRLRELGFLDAPKRVKIREKKKPERVRI